MAALCCRWCGGFIFTCGLSALFMWLSFRPSKPTLSIEEFYVPALDKAAHPNLTAPPLNTTLEFKLRLKNSNKDKGIYYDALNLTFYYNETQVGDYTIEQFYQGYKKTAHKPGLAEVKGAFWGYIFKVGQGAKFKVRVVTSVRYKLMSWKTRHHGINVAGELEVGDNGHKSGKKDVELGSAAVRSGFQVRWIAGWAFWVGLMLLL